MWASGSSVLLWPPIRVQQLFASGVVSESLGRHVGQVDVGQLRHGGEGVEALPAHHEDLGLLDGHHPRGAGTVAQEADLRGSGGGDLAQADELVRLGGDDLSQTRPHQATPARLRPRNRTPGVVDRASAKVVLVVSVGL